MGQIPNFLHFISPLVLFSNSEIVNILSWSENSPFYTTYLWIPDGQHITMYQKITDVLRHTPLVTKVDIKQLPDSAHLTWIKAGSSHLIKIKQFSSIPNLAPKEVLFLELEKFERHHIVRELASFWVLHQYGGIFVDTDTQTSPSPVPPNIKAPRNILLAKYHRSFPKLVPNVIAGCARTPQLVSLHNAYRKHYRHDFAITDDPNHPRLPFHITDQLDQMHYFKEELIRLVQVEQTIGLHSEFDRRRKQHLLEQLARSRSRLKIGEHSSMDITRRWMLKQIPPQTLPAPPPPFVPPPPPLPSGERVPPDFETGVVLPPHEDEERPLSELDMLFRQQTADEHAEYLLYSFQDQSGCHPRIPASALNLVPQEGGLMGGVAESWERNA